MNTIKMLAMTTIVSGLLTNVHCYASMITIQDNAPLMETGKDISSDKFTLCSKNSVHVTRYGMTTDIEQTNTSVEPSNKSNRKLEVVDCSKDFIEKRPLRASKNGFLAFSPYEYPLFSSAGSISTDSNFLVTSAETPQFIAPQNTDNPTTFAITPNQLVLAKNPDELMLDISNPPEIGLAIDSVSLSAEQSPANVPEPAILGLVGISLTALSLVNKKKRMERED